MLLIILSVSDNMIVRTVLPYIFSVLFVTKSLKG